MTTNFWFALDFFLWRACFQGRRDEVSEKVCKEIICVLKPEFADSKGTGTFVTLREQGWGRIRRELGKRIGKGLVGKARDIEMVLSTLDFIGRIPDLNIVKYSVEEISQGRLEKHYGELQSSHSEKGITQVGPKIAAFYLRDVVSLYELEPKIPPKSGYCLQPVDTWVRKLASRLDIVGEKPSDREIPEAIVNLCRSEGVSPVLFNQGAWYVGYHSLDIVLDILGTRK